MKKLFIMLAAAATVVSCAKEQTIVADQGEAIEFGNVFVDNATRAASATDPSYSTTEGKGVALTEFNVYGAVGGVNIFDGDKVVKGDAAYGAAWALEDPNQKAYWIDGADYEFVAVVDGNKEVGEKVITETTTNASGIPTYIAYNSDGATDLLCARVVRNAENGVTNKDMVAFGFTHLLSKVKFSVKNTTNATATNYRIVLTSAKITGAHASNTYNVADGAWGTGTDTKEFALENLTVNSGATEYHPTELLLLPGATLSVTVTADIQATQDGGTTWKRVSGISKTFSDVATLAKAQAYHFAVTMGVGTEIQFTATEMGEWGNGNTTDTNSDNTNDAVVLQ